LKFSSAERPQTSWCAWTAYGWCDCRSCLQREEGLHGGSDSLRWIESPSDLPVTVAVPPESALEKLQLIMKTFVSTQGSGPMYQRGKHRLL
jgi:hypothetical protein